MYNQNYGDRSMVDKMMRLFIIQAISGFVSRDYDTGIHFLNEVKTHYAQNMSQLNPTLKGLAKEIIQSLDMLTPGHDATQFYSQNVDDGGTPLSEPAKQKPRTVNDEISNILNRRKKKKEGEDEPIAQPEPKVVKRDDLFGDLGDLTFDEEDNEGEEDYDVYDKILKERLGKDKFDQIKGQEDSSGKDVSISRKLSLSPDELEEAEDNAILEILLKRKAKKGNISSEDQQILNVLEERKVERAREKEESNPLTQVKRKRKRRSHDSSLWED